MNFSLEIGPHTNIDDLPPVKDIYITLLPGGDYVETAKKAGDLAKKGFNPVPHFPARSITDEAQLNDYVSRCKDLGVKQALVIGGGHGQVGVFESLIQILETGYFEGVKIGIAGHTDGSLDISASTLEKAMKDKKPYADYIVTQWLMESDPIIKVVSKQTIPMQFGITGPMKVSGLLKFANTVGAKNSINFIKSNLGKTFDLLRPKDPNDLIKKVKSVTSNFHIYTFGSLKETNTWLMEKKYA